jgi:hypothetical protein
LQDERPLVPSPADLTKDQDATMLWLIRRYPKGNTGLDGIWRDLRSWDY